MLFGGWDSIEPPRYLPSSPEGRDEGILLRGLRGEQTCHMVYFKGKPVYELISPEGGAYIMQSSNIPADDSIAKLGERLKLPQRWKFRTRILDEDFALRLDGKVKTILDDLRNVYNLMLSARYPNQASN
jgi:hypothetical protein